MSALKKNSVKYCPICGTEKIERVKTRYGSVYYKCDKGHERVIYSR